MNPIGLLAAGMTTIRTVPQVARTLRTRSTAGLPLRAMAFSAVTLVAWATYGAVAGLWPLAVSSAVAALGYAAVVTRAVLRDRRYHQLAPAAAWALALSATAVVGAVQHLPAVLLAAPLVVATATVRKVLVSSDLSGIAPGTYAIELVEGVLWVGYALSIAHLPLAVNSLLYVVADVVVITRWTWWHHAARQAPVATAP